MKNIKLILTFALFLVLTSACTSVELTLTDAGMATSEQLPLVVQQDTYELRNKFYTGSVEKDYLMFIGNSLIVDNLTLVDNNETGSAHRDGIQIIPPHGTNYTGGHVDSVKISNTTITANGKLQGIFASDGSIDNVYIKDVNIETNSYHSITLGGVQKAHFENCKTSTPIKLFPLRLFGGTEDGRSIWIIESAPKATVINCNVQDLRIEEHRGWNIYRCDYQYIISQFDNKSKTYSERRQIFLKEAKKKGCVIVERY